MHGFLTPVIAGPEIPVSDWLARQVDLLRDAVAAGEPEAAEILRFAGVARGPRLDLGDARRAIASLRTVREMVTGRDRDE